ncbi:DUF1800 family protein [Pleionea sp. CnH1-48]|uniref:DUF1800 domain-containing protein n=1 Tax=Pleionea sp. CnH1-48 TaxID=2954494 RepID=UPI0020974B74|nr:DUF1800 family protein [Pleionea sp. CnH1-48]MCO7226058.1 DUF1800 family protein [Pleionea sp. CnH1-48]
MINRWLYITSLILMIAACGGGDSGVTPPPQNQAPIANAGANQTVASQSTVTLDASNSRDPDGSIRAYSWTQISGSSVNLQNTMQAQVTFTAPSVTQNTNLGFRVTVTDNSGATATDDVAVQVTPSNTQTDSIFKTKASTTRFLTQATFGPKPQEVDQLTGSAASDWLLAEFNKPSSLHLPLVQQFGQLDSANPESAFGEESPSFAFWTNAIGADDQLRQRMAFALSEIFVVSNFGENLLFDNFYALGAYQDIMVQHAFGNYRELLEAVTYSPAMGFYLTYLENQKGDPSTGRTPDENYAREVLQLFSIGLVKLNKDGSLVKDAQGNAIETYTNADITGLAKVFTGLSLNTEEFFSEFSADDPNVFAMPMKAFPAYHSSLEKTFLGTTIAANTGPTQSIKQALDTIFNHPNVAPFISRQLIQRFVTSHPSPQYVERVATAFESGHFRLPNRQLVGDGRRGDLKATLAAILFDEAARSDAARAGNTFGKIREPILRFTTWARTFNAGTITPEYLERLWDTSSPEALAQHPYRSRSVFNFYRPGYVAPGTQSGAANLTIPELQILNASSMPGYINFMNYFVNAAMIDEDYQGLADEFSASGINLDASRLQSTLVPNYQEEMRLANNPQTLVDRLDLILTYNTMSPETKNNIVAAITAIPSNGATSSDERVKLAILMVMTSPDFLVQR